MKSIRKPVRNMSFFLACMLITISLYCQPYEIRAVNKDGGIIGVQMRVTGGTAPTTANFITDIVFGIKWSATYNVDITEAITTSYNIRKAGTRSLKNGFHFQAFFSEPIGFNLPSNWTVNEWVDIMSVPNTKTGTVPTGNFEIAEKGFDVTTEPNIGVDFVDYPPTVNGIAFLVIIPVTLIKFTVTPLDDLIQLQWSTASEQNNKGFEVERSESTGDNFAKIGFIAGKGNSIIANEYSFTDKNVVDKTKYFYRLKQIDLDEQYKFSEIRTAILVRLDNEFIRIMPNPVGRVLQIFLNNSEKNEMVSLKIVDAKGRLVLTQNVYIDDGKKADINITNLISGQYYLTVSKNKDFIHTKAFIKK